MTGVRMLEQRDVTINASGMTAGGRLRKVVIRGEGSVTNDVECAQFIIRGSSKALGDVHAEEVKIAGQSIFKGNVNSDKISVFGQGEFLQDVHSKDMQIWGNAVINGDLKSDDVNVRGRLTVHGDIEAETFYAKGAFKVEGLLNAGTFRVSIRNYGSCEANEIGGEKIIVERKNGLLGLFNKNNLLYAESIEGDDISLEYTSAKVVRGTNVKIGPGCEIDIVEYKNNYQVDSDAWVKGNRQI